VDIVISRSKGRKSSSSVQALIDAATLSVGVASTTKDLILKQEASLLLHLQEQAEETMKLMRSLSDEKMKKDMEILTSIKGIGEKTALYFLIEMGRKTLQQRQKTDRCSRARSNHV
jgi:transposase